MQSSPKHLYFEEKKSLQNETLFYANLNRTIFFLVIIYNNFVIFDGFFDKLEIF